MSHQLINQDTINIYCDGGARGNPGPAASAFVVKDQSGRIVHQQGVFLGTATNNQAEYQAVIESLNWILNNRSTVQQINYYLDSLLVVNQLNGVYKIKDPTLKLKHLKTKNSIDKLLAQGEAGRKKLKFSYTPRNNNFLADKLVNETLDKTLL
ncbi:hypothetical protein A3D85_00345 [Candidatus Amesbacteria bacterium RIFCSPHIGHO2_02_FULL_47_9]|uniref:RNase H type-1 domain-containing protein n=1 Tax=Candidatus Amesbacteria bacterium RIFCSPHIGHO2_01_FULL_48_32b TaxID=1797253 RepID=A0A1F4YGW1_9BACT|nr:MAG: hypothetical protein A2876_01050 [Candidatus Amesbacteria bacterium RIFCSPHIGHO2_01_FULL_48_32b]OGD03528.1 MAG: hypothetical protein A3D85_00345 [Candidatus Amesbacteria bacterium RIFCSPHIGHO2_02_FULL_47_9]OGD07396.1 MAG: hypothetical protein A2899_03780 [Candidatus Amesbacteria bacterium RIFCSPLOWO2_01_FULL_49_25]